MDNREALVALNMTDGVGPVRLRTLLENFEEPQKILSASRAELERIHGIGHHHYNVIS